MIKLYLHSQPADIPYDPLGLTYDKTHRAHSFVWGFLSSYWAQVTQLPQSVLDTAGLARLLSPHLSNLQLNTGLTVSTWGLIPGKGSTPPQPNDYKLGIQIPHGAGAGALMYASVAFSAPWVAPPNIYAAVHRIFTNTSGSPITVTELALYGGTGIAGFAVCYTHDILSAPATIQNGQAYRFIYTFCTPVG